jgi:hypothetical protein
LIFLDSAGYKSVELTVATWLPDYASGRTAVIVQHDLPAASIRWLRLFTPISIAATDANRQRTAGHDFVNC